MIAVLQNLAPEALILFAGFLLTAIGWFPDQALKGLSKFAYSVAIPVMLFAMMAGLDLPDQAPWPLWLSYFSGTLVTLGLAAFVSIRYMGATRAAGASFAISGTFSNSVVLGIPFHLAVIGPEASLPVFSVVAIHAPVLLVVSTLIAGSGSGGSLARTLVHTVTETLRNPVIIGLVAGLVWALFELPLPQVIGSAVGKISTAALPLALFALGGTLAGLKLKGSLPAISLMMVAKLLVHPLITIVLALYVFDLPPLFAHVLILNACLPTGINAFLFAAYYREVETSVAGMILIATPVSLVLYAAVASVLLTPG